MFEICSEILGFVAGATTLVSSVPQLVANLRDPALTRGQNPARNCLQCAGNLLWLWYALQVGSVAMTTFAALGAVMAGALAVQTFKHSFVGEGSAKLILP